VTAYQSDSWVEGKDRAVQVIPFVDEAATPLPGCVGAPKATAAKTPDALLTVTPYQPDADGIARPVHVIPLVDEAASAVLLLTATKRPVVGLQVAPNQTEGEGANIVRVVHVIPSVEEAASLKARAMKTPVPGLTAREYQVLFDGKVRAVHVIPSVEEAALSEL